MNAILKPRIMAQLLKVAFILVSFALMLLSKRRVLKTICFLILMSVLLNVLSAIKDLHKNIIYSIIYWYIKISSLLNVRFANKDSDKVILWSSTRRNTIIRNWRTTCIYIILYLNVIWYLFSIIQSDPVKMLMVNMQISPIPWTLPIKLKQKNLA